MKKTLLLLAFIVQTITNAQTYYDLSNQEITKSEFNNLLQDERFFSVANDSLNVYKLMHKEIRSEKGMLNDSENLFKELNEKLSLKLDSNKPLIIYYYPGKDPCNSGGANRKNKIKRDNELADVLASISPYNELRVYKNSIGIKTLQDFAWKKDPNGLIEKRFFKYHYPCSSFVIIYKNKYYAQFGEYSQEMAVNAFKNILKK